MTEQIYEKFSEIISKFIDEEGINVDDVSNYDVTGFINLMKGEGKSDVEIAQSILKIYVSRRCRAAIEKDDFSEKL